MKAQDRADYVHAWKVAICQGDTGLAGEIKELLKNDPLEPEPKNSGGNLPEQTQASNPSGESGTAQTPVGQSDAGIYGSVGIPTETKCEPQTPVGNAEGDNQSLT